ncbi:neurogenic locus notch homolog protein 3 isoform X3 [Chironomus tepperi]|uniref:neurogenic locus notch homolog protein 3 isoform X3 n=1 Tax=Chironomus tepperi TaxID=113505 RepID=UPI00391F3344
MTKVFGIIAVLLSATNVLMVSGQGCSRNPCGQNALCQETLGGRPVCSCPPGYSGNPLSFCQRGECNDHIDCRLDQHCMNNRCTNPCVGKCGISANCEVVNHVAVCSCPARYRGDPLHQCRQIDPDEACHPSPCGVNTQCRVENEQPVCSCLPSFKGNPITGCTHECESDHDCGSSQYCKNFKCFNACDQCGKGALCNGVINHRPQCECPKTYIGSPFTECRPECYGDVDCPSSKPACIYGICKNPCDGACGVNANCVLRGLTPICSCPRDMTGDPFISCRPFVPEDLCRPNPCGNNAICTPGHDNTGKERPVCSCPPGYTGNALRSCQRGECLANEECPDNRACINYACVDPCIGKCGLNAVCSPKNHLAVCTCPNGFSGDAKVSCRQSKAFPIARYSRSLLKHFNETIADIEDNVETKENEQI